MEKQLRCRHCTFPTSHFADPKKGSADPRGLQDVLKDRQKGPRGAKRSGEQIG
jgi:hypothetical protein